MEFFFRELLFYACFTFLYKRSEFSKKGNYGQSVLELHACCMLATPAEQLKTFFAVCCAESCASVVILLIIHCCSGLATYLLFLCTSFTLHFYVLLNTLKVYQNFRIVMLFRISMTKATNATIFTASTP